MSFYLRPRLLNYVSILISIFSMQSCSSIGNFLFGRKEVPALRNDAGETLRAESSSRYEWAIQHYESGHYESALNGLQDFENAGATLNKYPLVPFYLGMSHFQLGRCKEATENLQKFITASPGMSEAQAARLSIMECEERANDWRGVVSLAAETERFPLYAESRIRLKLLWTKALFKLSEISGAKASLKETEELVSNFSRDPDHSNDLNNAQQEFEARLFHLHTMLDLEDCEKIAGPKQKDQKNAQVLVERWLETKGDCLLNATTKALELGIAFSGEQADLWIASLHEYFVNYYNSPQYLLEQKLYADLRDAGVAAKPKIRAALYRLSAAIAQKINEKRATVRTQNALKGLQKQIEDLLLQLSLLS